MPIASNGSWVPFDLPNISGFYGMFDYANSVTGDSFGTITLFAVFIIAFIATKRYPSEISFATSSYIATVMAILFRLLLWVSDTVVIAFILMTAFTTLLLVRREIY